MNRRGFFATVLGAAAARVIPKPAAADFYPARYVKADTYTRLGPEWDRGNLELFAERMEAHMAAFKGGNA